MRIRLDLGDGPTGRIAVVVVVDPFELLPDLPDRGRGPMVRLGPLRRFRDRLGRGLIPVFEGRGDLGLGEEDVHVWSTGGGDSVERLNLVNLRDRKWRNVAKEIRGTGGAAGRRIRGRTARPVVGTEGGVPAGREGVTECAL